MGWCYPVANWQEDLCSVLGLSTTYGACTQTKSRAHGNFGSEHGPNTCRSSFRGIDRTAFQKLIMDNSRGDSAVPQLGVGPLSPTWDNTSSAEIALFSAKMVRPLLLMLCQLSWVASHAKKPRGARRGSAKWRPPIYTIPREPRLFLVEAESLYSSRLISFHEGQGPCGKLGSLKRGHPSPVSRKP